MIVLFPPWWLHFVFCFHHDDCPAFIVMIVLFPQQWLSCFCSDYFSVFCFHSDDRTVSTMMIPVLFPWLFCFHSDDWTVSTMMTSVLFPQWWLSVRMFQADDCLVSVICWTDFFVLMIILLPLWQWNVLFSQWWLSCGKQKWLTCFYSENVPVFIMRMVKLALWCLSTLSWLDDLLVECWTRQKFWGPPGLCPGTCYFCFVYSACFWCN